MYIAIGAIGTEILSLCFQGTTVKLGWDTGNVVMHQGSGKEKKTGKRINVGGWDNA